MKKRKQRWTEFSFYYSIRPFIALQSCGELLQDEKVKWQLEEWNQAYLGELLSCVIDTTEIEDLSAEYFGKISVELIELSPSGVVVGRDMMFRMQPHDEGVHGSLPAAKFKIKIQFQGLDGKIVKGLKAILKETKRVDWKVILEEEAKRQREWKALKTRKKIGDAEAIEFEKKENEIKKVLEGLSQEFKEIPEISDNLFWNIMVRVAPVLSKITEERDEEGNKYRSRLSGFLSRLKDDAKANHPRKPHFDVEIVENFGSDLFQIFKHYMNLIIRFFKYDQQQYWLQEIQSTDCGYFFIKNEVKMNNEGPLIPDTKHHLEMQKLEREYLIHEPEWIEIRSSVSDLKELRTKAGGFSLGGVFSQAIISVESKHLESAVVLGMVGLEAAMSHLIEYFKGQDTIITNYSARVTFVKRVLETAGISETIGREYEFLWGLIEGKAIDRKKTPKKYYEYEDGLIPLRNEVIHEKKQIEKGMQRRIVEYISAARSLSFTIENWLETEPDKTLVDGIRIEGFRKQRRKSRRK